MKRNVTSWVDSMTLVILQESATVYMSGKEISIRSNSDFAFKVYTAQKITSGVSATRKSPLGRKLAKSRIDEIGQTLEKKEKERRKKKERQNQT